MSWDDLKIPTELRNARGSEKFITFFKATGGKALNILLSSAMLRDETIKDYVILGYSPSKNAIAMFFTDEASHPAAIRLTRRSKTKSATLAIQSFLNASNIDKSSIGKRYVPTKEQIGDKIAWVISLTKISS